MKTTMAFKAMAEAVPYVAELMEDEDLKAYSESRKDGHEPTLAEIMRKIMPVYLIKKPETVCGLLGALCGKTANEIENQEWEKTREIMNSPMLNDLFDFFIFAARTARNA